MATGGPPPPAALKGNKSASEQRAAQALQAALAKPKRILVLARYYFSYETWISNKFARIVLTDSSNEPFFDVTVRKKFEELIFLDNYETNGNVERLAIELHKKYNFTHVIYQAEQDIIRAARLREHFGIKGQSLASAMCFRDKVTMKECIAKNMTENSRKHFTLPECRRVRSALTILQFVEEFGLPVVVKPTAGMGSMNTYIIHTEEQLEAMLRAGVTTSGDGPIDLEIEKFVAGTMYHIDGFEEDGIVKLIWPSTYVNTCVSYKESKFLGSYQLHADNPLTQRLRECTIEILNCLDKPRAFSFHVEVFHTPEDTFVLCEAACRTGGAGVAPATLWLTLVDINKATLEAQCDEPPSSEHMPASWNDQPTPKLYYGWICVYPRQGLLESVSTTCAIEEVMDFQLSPKREFLSIEHCTDALASFLVKGENEQQVKDAISRSVDWLLSSCVWQETK